MGQEKPCRNKQKGDASSARRAATGRSLGAWFRNISAGALRFSSLKRRNAVDQCSEHGH